ncbi:MAG TPA: DMT family transporter [Candidatus Eisenbacteria bacterium]
MRRADATLLLIAAIWGTTFALLRDTMRVLHPFELMALRFSLATVILAAVYWRRLVPVRWSWVRDGAWLGVWLTLGYLTQVMGLLTITASRSAFITSTYIAFTPFVAWIAFRSRPAIGDFLAVAIVFLGLTRFSSETSFAFGPGEIWTLGCALSFAIQMVVTHIVGKRGDPIPLSVAQMAVGAVVGWILVGTRGGFRPSFGAVPWGVLLYLAAAATALVIALQTWALPRTSSVKAALLFSTEPIFAAAFAMAFFAERMTSREYFGAALVLAGVLFSELWRPALARLSGRARPPETRRPEGNARS